MQQQRQFARGHSIVYGISYRSTTTQSTTITGDHPETEEGLYAQDEIRLARTTTLFTGLRLDNHSVYGVNISPRVTLLHHLPGRQTLRASYGSAFRAPTLLDQFWKQSVPLSPGASLTLQGAANLQPEQLASFEAGWRKDVKRGFYGISLFYSSLSQLIGFRPIAFAPPPAPPYTPTVIARSNLGSASSYGLEMESELRLSGTLSAVMNYAYESLSFSDGTTPELAPRHKVNIGMHATFSPRWDGFLGAHFVGACVYNRFGQYPDAPIRPYVRVDARLAYRVGTAARPWTVALSATNLFGSHYELPDQPQFGDANRRLPVERTVYFSLIGAL